MINIKKIDLKNFKDLQEKAKIIIVFDFFKEAFELSQKLEKEIKVNPTIQVSQYYDILYKLKWVALPKLKDGEAKEMFASHFMVIFKIAGFDIWRKLKSKIINDIFYDERNNFKNKIKKILLDNEEIITSKRILVNQKIVNPSIANWLRDYNINVSSEFINKEEQVQYLTYSENIKKIDKPEEKERLKILFKIYEKLKTSSLIAVGIEEDIYMEDESGNMGVLSEGMFTKIDDRIGKQINLMSKIILGEPIDEKDKVDVQLISGEDKKAGGKDLKVGAQEIVETKQAQKMPEKILENKISGPIEIKTLKQEKEIIGGDVLFDKSDDKEIKKMQAETDELKNSAGAQGTDLNLESEEIIKKLSLHLNSFLTARLKNIIISALKGIRDKIGIKEVLLRSTENGGMGFGLQEIDEILKKIQDQKEIIKNKPIRIKNNELKIKEKRTSHPDGWLPDSVKSKIKEKENVELLPNKEGNNLLNGNSAKALAPPPPVQISDIGDQKSDVRFRKSEVRIKNEKEKKEVGNQQEVASQRLVSLGRKSQAVVESLKSKVESKEKELVQEDKKEKKQGFFGRLFWSKKEGIKKNGRNKNIIADNNGIVTLSGDHSLGVASSATVSSQRQVGDSANLPPKQEKDNEVKKDDRRDYLNDEKSKLVGPIEELKYLNIEDFRSWSKDPMKSIEKIEKKIDIAGEKFFEKRILGIKAWKKSEINMLYLDILNDGLIKHKQIEEIIEERNKERKTVLNKDEFEAIMELNRRLRF